MALFEQRMVEIEGAMLEIVVGGAGQPLICTSHPCWPPNGQSAQAAQDDATLQSLAAVSSVVWVNPRGSGNSSPIHSTSDRTSTRCTLVPRTRLGSTR